MPSPNEKYLVQWADDNELAIMDGWNLAAILHQDGKEKQSSLTVLRKATQHDIDKYQQKGA